MPSEKESLNYLNEGLRGEVFNWLLDAHYWLGYMVGISDNNLGVYGNELKFSWYSSWGIRVFISPNNQHSSYHDMFMKASNEFRQRTFEYRLPKDETDNGLDASFLKSVSEIEYLIQKFFPDIHHANTWTICNVLESDNCIGKRGFIDLCDIDGELRICENCNKLMEEKRQRASRFDGFIYLIGNQEQKIYKIGLSRQPKERFKAFNTKLPFKVEILHQIEATDMKKAERLLHMWMKDKNTHGEWFSLSQRDVEFIRSLATFEKDNFIDSFGNVVSGQQV